MKRQENTLEVMTNHKKIVTKNFTYNLIGAKVPTHVHINNHETNKQSVIVPIDILKELLEGE